MWLGPVFQAELLTLSRRARFFAGRFLYGVLVLLVVSFAYHAMAKYFYDEGEIPIQRLAAIGQAIFAAFAWLQGLIALVMTPALVAGSIADEKQRKTLHYLMASQLSAPEIILGKVAARLLRIGVLAAIGLPVLSLIGLFGGVDYEEAALIYGATATTTFLLAGVAILCSVHAAKPRDAIIQTYLVEIAWLTVAPLCLATMPAWSPGWQAVGEFCRPALAYLAISSPSDLLRNPRMYGPPGDNLPVLAWMMALQVVGGIGMLVGAALRLRPVSRGLDGPGWRARWARRKGGRLRIWRRPPIGADAMLWKELHVQRIGDAWRILLLLGCAVFLGVLITAMSEAGRMAVREALDYGYWAYGPRREELNSLLRVINALAMVALIMGLGTVAASSVSSEREGDTWINLAASPIEGPEFVRAKILGALWLFRPVGYLLLACWGFGLATGAIHPVGALICLVEVAIFAWFVGSLGVYVSLRSKNSIQALGMTIGVLLFVNAGYLFLCLLFQVFSELILLGCMPYLSAIGLLGDDLGRRLDSRASEVFGVVSLGTLCYGLGAAALTGMAIGGYDRVVDRPDRSRGRPTAERAKEDRMAPAEL